MNVRGGRQKPEAVTRAGATDLVGRHGRLDVLRRDGMVLHVVDVLLVFAHQLENGLTRLHEYKYDGQQSHTNSGPCKTTGAWSGGSNREDVSCSSLKISMINTLLCLQLNEDDGSRGRQLRNHMIPLLKRKE